MAVSIPARESDRAHAFSLGGRIAESLDLLVAGVALLLTTGFLTIAAYPAWSLRFAVMVAVIPAGTVLLGRLILRRDLTAALLTAWLVWCALSSLFQAAPWIHLFGMVSHDASVLLYLSAACCWALGRSLSAHGRRVLFSAVLLGFAMNAVMGLLQVALAIRAGSFVLVGNRAHGLTSYSVYFGAYMAAACLMLIGPTSRRYLPQRLAAVFIFAVAGGMSGSRIALVAVIAGAAVLAIVRRCWFSGAALTLVTVGTILGSAIAGWRLGAATGDGGTSLQRLGVGGAGAGGIGWRIDGWLAGVEAFIDRPVTGWGVGNFRQAIDGHFGAGLSQDAPRFDAHNIAVELLVATGVIGLAGFMAFCVLCALRSRGPFAMASVTMAAIWLLQPAGLPTLGLTFLLLGAAMPATDLATWNLDGARHLLGVAAIVGVFIGGFVVVVDYRLARAIESPNPGKIEAAARWYPFDPKLADYVAQAHMFQWDRTGSESSSDEAIAWSERAIERQPDVPYWLDSFAQRRMRLGDFTEARPLLDDALQLQPQRRETMAIYLVLAREIGDVQLQREITRKLCEAGSSLCEDLREALP